MKHANLALSHGNPHLLSRRSFVQAGALGRGEAQGVYYLEETAQSMFEQVHAIAGEIRKGINREDLLPRAKETADERP